MSSFCRQAADSLGFPENDFEDDEVEEGSIRLVLCEGGMPGCKGGFHYVDYEGNRVGDCYLDRAGMCSVHGSGDCDVEIT